MAERLTVKIEEAQLIFKNFSGAPDRFNPDGGKRQFAVVLDEENARAMLADGWNVKWPQERENDEEGVVRNPYITIAVSFKVRPPKIVLITSVSRTQLSEEMVGTLDWANIQQCDLIFNASYWEVGDKTGVKAYLKTMYVTVEEDELERKYALLMAEPEV